MLRAKSLARGGPKRTKREKRAEPHGLPCKVEGSVAHELDDAPLVRVDARVDDLISVGLQAR